MPKDWGWCERAPGARPRREGQKKTRAEGSITPHNEVRHRIAIELLQEEASQRPLQPKPRVWRSCGVSNGCCAELSGAQGSNASRGGMLDGERDRLLVPMWWQQGVGEPNGHGGRLRASSSPEKLKCPRPTNGGLNS